uniref:glutathione gamma-glutamylcysteinyltransferase n=1 Tax=Pyrodinium bahamense TaxID=73915 RepID=A0A7S0A024_9DINO
MAKLAGGIHRRPLPEPAIAFSSPEGRALFREALADGTAEIFYPLIEQFHTQDEPAFCGLATLVMVLNSLGVDPGATWKGPWRWYHEKQLSCCKDPELVAQVGIEWDEWVCLAECQGLAVDAKRVDEEGSSLADFESQCAAACAQPGGLALVISYTRQVVRQSGDGHYSPIGAYHRGRSLALVLDTARFKYPPHWLPVALLWEAMSAKNSSTGRSRGYATLRRGDVCGPSVFALKAAWLSWRALDMWAAQDLPVLVPEGEATAETEVWAFARSLPPAVASLVNDTATTVGGNCMERREDRAAVLEALRGTLAYQTLAAASQSRPGKALPASMESLALLVILLGRMGLLGEVLPHARQAGLWYSASRGGRSSDEAPQVEEEERSADALEDELQFLQLRAEHLLTASRTKSDPCRCRPCTS